MNRRGDLVPPRASGDANTIATEARNLRRNRRPLLEGSLAVRGIGKSFGTLLANDDITAAFRTGEVHGLLGENGAGKSTLVKLLAGIYRPDAGSIEIDGAPVTVASPLEARRLGIAVVHQHSTLIPALTVLENVQIVEGGLGRVEPSLGERLDRTAKSLGFEIDPYARAADLSVGQRQRVEITRALMHSARFVILDEPSSVLAPPERAELFAVIERMVRGGAGVVLVTHRLEEALHRCTRLTMLRQGKVVGRSDNPRALREADLVRTLVGEVPSVQRSPRRRGDMVVRAKALDGGPPDGVVLHGVDLDVHAGEILGVAGVDGNGQRELAAALVGAWRPEDGVVLLHGRPITEYAAAQLADVIADIADDDVLGLIEEMSVWQNLALRHLSWGGAPTPRQRTRARSDAVELARRFEIKSRSVETPVGRLSGGNRRRVMLARELSKRPQLVVASYATKGLDVRSIEQVKGWMLRLADGGAAVVYIASELEELLAIADRIAVLSRGRVAGLLSASEATGEQIGRLMLACSDDGPGQDVGGVHASVVR